MMCTSSPSRRSTPGFATIRVRRFDRALGKRHAGDRNHRGVRMGAAPDAASLHRQCRCKSDRALHADQQGRAALSIHRGGSESLLCALACEYSLHRAPYRMYRSAATRRTIRCRTFSVVSASSMRARMPRGIRLAQPPDRRAPVWQTRNSSPAKRGKYGEGRGQRAALTASSEGIRRDIPSRPAPYVSRFAHPLPPQAGEEVLGSPQPKRHFVLGITRRVCKTLRDAKSLQTLHNLNFGAVGQLFSFPHVPQAGR